METHPTLEASATVEFEPVKIENRAMPGTSRGTATMALSLPTRGFSSTTHTYSLLASFSGSSPLREPEALVPR